MSTTIGFIGAGNMATALIEGLLGKGIPPSFLHASDMDPNKLDLLSAKGIQVTQNNTEIIERADIVVIAVKPQVLPDVLSPLKSALVQHNILLVSIAAGITTDSLQDWSHSEQAIVRCMPNTPALVAQGASGLYANAYCSDNHKKIAEEVLNAVGITRWVDNEDLLHAVTALSGSGPAYFFLMMEAMQEAAEALGLCSETARSLCLQTALGAAVLANESDQDISQLRKNVTSPGGTTAAALEQFEADHYREIVDRALQKAAERSEQLGQEFSSNNK